MSSNAAGPSAPHPHPVEVVALLREVFQVERLGSLNDASLVEFIQQLEHVGKSVDYLRVMAAAQADRRSNGAGTFAQRHGHRTSIDFLRELTLQKRSTIADRIDLARSITAPVLPTPDPGSETELAIVPDIMGDPDGNDADPDLPPIPPVLAVPPEASFPRVALALEQGALSLDAALEIVRGLETVTGQIDDGVLRHAEHTLVAFATGDRLPDAPPVGPAGAPDGGVGDGGVGDGGVGDDGVADGTDPDGTAAAPEGDAEHDAGAEPVAGVGPFLPEHADRIRAFTKQFTQTLNPATPKTVRQQEAERYIRLGHEKDGLVPITGKVTPEVAAALARGFDAMNAPAAGKQHRGNTSTPTGAPTSAPTPTGMPTPSVVAAPSRVRFVDVGAQPEDDRTPAQKRHDRFAGILHMALQHEDMPTLGGTSVALTIQVTETELAKPDGQAWMRDHYGTLTRVPAAAARHAGCAGTISRVTQTQHGRIIGIESASRVFTPHQRKAITLRDQGCVIPGCDIPATWCEIHHVDEYANGGPTHTDNGVMLCYFHHRNLGSHGWDVRMRDGIPEVRPPEHVDNTRQWRPSRPPITTAA